jgi:hypothetical protein
MGAGPYCPAPLILFDAPSSKIPAYNILKGPPTKQMIAAKATSISRNVELTAKLDSTPKIGTTKAPDRNRRPPCFTPFLRGDIWLAS